jgi:hypothetical protein
MTGAMRKLRWTSTRRWGFDTDASQREEFNTIQGMSDKIQHFLKQPENSVTREKIFLNRFEFDIRMAATRVQIPLSISIADVDRNGHDVTLDNEEYSHKIQLKTVASKARTDKWEVFKRFFRPPIEYAERLGIVPSPETIGLGGGIVVMEISDFDTGEIKYHYTNELIVRAFELAIIKPALKEARSDRRTKAVQPKAYDLLRTLEHNFNEEKAKNKGYDPKRVDVARDLFITVKSPNHLLGILGFANSIDSSFQWPNLFLGHYLGLPRKTNNGMDSVLMTAPQSAYLAAAANGLLQFSDESVVTDLREPPCA